MPVKMNSAAFDCYETIFSQTICKEETQESVVPDVLPDIGTILSATGPVLIRSKDLSEGRVRIEANLPAKLAFAAEESGEVHCMEINIPFYVSAEDAAITENCVCIAELRLAALEPKLLNPRKVSLRAEVCVTLRCFAQGGFSLPCAAEESTACVNTLTRALSFSPLESVLEKTFILTDEYPLPPEKSESASGMTILAQDLTLQTEDLKCVGNKIVLKASAQSSLCCLDEDGTVQTLSFSTEFSQILEAESLPETPFLKLTLLPSGVYYSFENDGARCVVSVELHLVAQAEIYGCRRAEYIADAYSNRYALECAQEKKTLCAIEKDCVFRETLRETFETAMPVAEVLGGWVESGEVGMEDEKLTAELGIRLCYRCTEGHIHMERRRFSLVLATAAEGETLVPTALLFHELYLAPASGGAEVRLPVEVRAFLCREQQLEYIAAISCDESAQLDSAAAPALVILPASSSDDLWAIAKENCSTVEAIRAANHLDALAAPWHRMILVPKSV